MSCNKYNTIQYFSLSLSWDSHYPLVSGSMNCYCFSAWPMEVFGASIMDATNWLSGSHSSTISDPLINPSCSAFSMVLAMSKAFMMVYHALEFSLIDILDSCPQIHGCLSIPTLANQASCVVWVDPHVQMDLTTVCGQRCQIQLGFQLLIFLEDNLLPRKVLYVKIKVPNYSLR